ncbi:MAG: hypothetical protein PSV18_07910 [Methylobacter sp.]|nr:hypothetical protein [Candidatus Methylobacter titanis]
MLLVIQAVVSFRSVPRILSLFNVLTGVSLSWIPHFTSVINWSLRLGLGLLKQVKPVTEPWLAIIDHSIDIGTKKALVVLRVPITALSLSGSAIKLSDCECIGLTISVQVNGESIARDLESIFNQAGTPKAIIKDGDYTLQKGVRLWSEKQPVDVPVIADIGHALATALKKQFEKSDAYKRFTTLTTQAAKCLRQTELAFLIPPKLRSKGRFQSIGSLGKWADKMLDVFAVPGRAKKGSLLAKLRGALPGFLQLKSFIKGFSNTASVVSQVLEILKNKGLDQQHYEQCWRLSVTLPKNSKVKKQLQQWLQQHLLIQQQLTDLPLLVSSDIIESLFGNFKHIIERSPQADMNRTTLLIPALCGNLDRFVVTQALGLVRHHDLEIWEKENIPYTVRKKRQAFFDVIKSQKAGKT